MCILTIYLVRHGEAWHNVDSSVMNKAHDSQHNLTEIGQEQAKETAEFLKDILHERTVFYSSPYKRALQTAQAIREALPNEVPLYENPLLREWELGNLYDVNDRPPEVKKEYKAAGRFYFRFRNGESLADVYLRGNVFANAVLQRLLNQQRYEDIVIVSHAGFMHLFMTVLMQLPEQKVENFTLLESIENASVLQLNEKDDGTYGYKKIFVPSIK